MKLLTALALLAVLSVPSLALASEPVRKEIQCQGDGFDVKVHRGQLTRRLWFVIHHYDMSRPLIGEIDRNEESRSGQLLSGGGFRMLVLRTGTIKSDGTLEFPAKVTADEIELSAPVACRYLL
jgi:hypothetical protein